MSVEVDIFFFAKAREIVGKKSSKITIPTQLTYTALARKIIDEFHLEILEKSVIIAVNEQYLPEETQICLKEGDKLAVIPPLSGG